MNKNRYAIVFTLLSQLASLYFVSRWNYIKIAGGDVDGALMMKLAHNILNGSWLGEYDKFTLVKSPGYAIWLAVANSINIKYTVFFHLFFLCSTVLYAYALKVYAEIKIKTLLILLPWFPYQYILETYRDTFLSILYFNCASLTLIFYKYENFLKKSKIRFSVFLGLILIYFLNVGFISITREDIYIVFVPALVLLIVGILKNYTSKARTAMKSIKVFSCVIFISTVSIYLSQTMVEKQNVEYYGVKLVNEWRYGAFPALLSRIESFNVQEKDRRFVITRAQRENLSTYSSNFREYTFDLDTDKQGWNAQGCIYLKICDDVTKAWFPWALRDSMEKEGIFINGGVFQNKTQELTSELSIICSRGLLPCEESGALDYLYGYSVTDVFREIHLMLNYLTIKKWHTASTWEEHNSIQHEQYFRDIDYEIAKNVIVGLPSTIDQHLKARTSPFEAPFFLFTKLLDKSLFLLSIISISLFLVTKKRLLSRKELEIFITFFILVLFQASLIGVNVNINYGLSLEIGGLSYAVGLKAITQIQFLSLIVLILQKFVNYASKFAKRK
jgi:hypothetical protein